MSTDISLLEEHPEPQRKLVRTLVTYLPLATLSLLPLWLSLESLLGGRWGALLPLTIMLLLTFSLTYQSYCAYRDLNASHEETRGSIRRIWSKGAVLWLFRSHYMLIGRSIFVIQPLSAFELKEGDVVEVRHLPRTKTVTTLRLVHRENAPAPPLPPGRFGRR